MSFIRNASTNQHAQEILKLADSIRNKLKLHEDIAKIEVAIYAVEQFEIFKENDYYNKKDTRAIQAIHAYTLYHSFFKKLNASLLKTENYSEAKRLDMLLLDYAHKALLQMRNVLLDLREQILAEKLAYLEQLQEHLLAANDQDEASNEEDVANDSGYDTASETVSDDLEGDDEEEEEENSNSSDLFITVDASTLTNRELELRFIDPIAQDSQQQLSPKTPSHTASSSSSALSSLSSSGRAAFFMTSPIERPATPSLDSLDVEDDLSTTERLNDLASEENSDEPEVPHRMVRANAIIGF